MIAMLGLQSVGKILEFSAGDDGLAL